MTNQELKNSRRNKMIAGIFTVAIHLSLALCLIIGPKEIANKVTNIFSDQDQEQTAEKKKAGNEVATIHQNKP